MVLFAPRRWLVPVVAAAVCLSPLYRLFAVIRFPLDFTSGELARDAFTPAWLDSLGAGALLALATQRGLGVRAATWSLPRVVLPITGTAYVLALLVYQYLPDTMAHVIVGDLAVSGLLYCLVAAASRGFGGPVGQVLELRPFVYLGKISYGIYVYHPFPPALLALTFARLGARYEQSGLLNFALSTAITVAIAAASWRFFEKPLNGLKRHFSYGMGASGLHWACSSPAYALECCFKSTMERATCSQRGSRVRPTPLPVRHLFQV